MNTFLNIVAEDIVRRARKEFNGNLKDFTIIFPNKRASLFFNQCLINHIQPPFWAPHYSTISDIFQQLSNLTLADPVLLIYYLYKAYIEVMKSNETFDHFYSWGEVLLGDFDDLDNNMVDAEKLFINVEELEQITSFDYIDAEQEEALRKLFASFNTETATELHMRYLRMWEDMPEIYSRFRTILFENGYAYPGMMKREVINRIREGLIDEKTTKLLQTNYAHTCIVGFNVLNKTEEELFRFLKMNYDTVFYWDYDNAYKDNPNFEAGRFIEDNIRIFGNKLPDHSELYNGLKGKKDIHFVASTTDNAQCRYAGQWLTQTLQPGERLSDTAVVLCDEHLLQPMLHTIPPTYGSNADPTLLNITMGYPMQETPVASFVLALIDLTFKGWKAPRESASAQSKSTKEGRWRFTYVDKVLKHPYTLMMNKQRALELLADCRQHNNNYPEQSKFTGWFIKTVFDVPPVDHLGKLRRIADILQMVATMLNKQKGNFNVLYSESIFNAWTMLNHFCELLEQHGLTFSTPSTLIRLLHQAISSKSVAFHGEPAIGVQIMGILETRNLDFKNVIMLSVNEGMLPKTSRQTSFILNVLREAYGMTTLKRQMSLYAYYFYRLLQRAEHVTMVYNNATDGLKRGEMSRFMMQLKYERAAIFSPLTTITEHTLSSSASNTAASTTNVSASDSNLIHVSKRTQAISSILANMKAISPTALSTYIKCQLQFYLTYICGFRQENDVTEDVGNDVFGNIFHEAMQLFYSNAVGKELTPQVFAQYVTLNPHGHHVLTQRGKEEVEKVVNMAFAFKMFNFSKQDVKNGNYSFELNGTQLLNYEVISRYVSKQIINDSRFAPLTIIELEQKHWQEFKFPVDGLTRSIAIGGIIDRIDVVTTENGKQLRIVDYKTSNKPQSAKSIDELFAESKTPNGYILQALYYSEVMMLEAKKDGKQLDAIAPTLLYIKKGEKENRQPITLGKDIITDYQTQCHNQFTPKLEALLTEVFRVDNEFVQTENDHHCAYCPFKALCNR